ncbi:MAG TPA: type II toxin-antitoxin system prevent-host-death family antitoxin [Chloroflexota bacterium]|jgi:prevent-host-death family protein
MAPVRRVGIRELRRQLSRVVDAVERGEIVEITRSGKPVARIAPMADDLPPEVARLLATGRVQGKGQPLPLIDPVPLIGEGPTVSEILLQQRDERDRAVLGE